LQSEACAAADRTARVPALQMLSPDRMAAPILLPRREAGAGRGVRANLGGELRRGASLHQRSPHGIADEVVHQGRLPEANFCFRGMNVDIDLARGNSRNSSTTGYTEGGMMLR